MLNQNGIILLDLFSGIGGFHKGILNAGVTITKCFFSEIDKYAIQVAMKNYPDTKQIGDVSKIIDDIGKPLTALKNGYACVTLKGSLDLLRYKALGNGFNAKVNAKVVEHILSHIK